MQDWRKALIEKFPNFDPAWSNEIKAQWFSIGFGNLKEVVQMSEDQNIYHHYDNDGPRVSVKVEKKWKCFNYEAHVQGCCTVESAMLLLKDAVARLKADFETPGV
jgi:hypothetical protein